MFIIIGTFDNLINEPRDAPKICSSIEEVHSIYDEWKTYPDLTKIRLFECVEVGYVPKTIPHKRIWKLNKTEVYECSKGHQFSTDADLPMINVDILEDKREPACPICLYQYRIDKIRDKKVISPYPMRLVHIK